MGGSYGKRSIMETQVNKPQEILASQLSPMAEEPPSMDSFMATWERGSPMRSFIYYLQRATCGALAYLVLHQTALGLRLLGLKGFLRQVTEATLGVFSLPGEGLVLSFLDPVRPMNLPPPLATFFLNILIYFFGVWLACYLFNWVTDKSFKQGKRSDPFRLKPKAP